MINSSIICLIPRDADHHFLSFAQQPFWFLEQLQPGNYSNHIGLCRCLAGSLNTVALKQSIEEIIRRHERFRANLLIDVNHTFTSSMHAIQGRMYL